VAGSAWQSADGLGRAPTRSPQRPQVHRDALGGMEVKAILHQLVLRNAWIPTGYEPVLDYGTGRFQADG
jgi:hypothetical protein